MNSSYWSPEESDELYQVSLDLLLGVAKAEPNEAHLASPDRHPLLRAAFVLGDLEAWHKGANQPEAELEARLEHVPRRL